MIIETLNLYKLMRSEDRIGFSGGSYIRTNDLLAAEEIANKITNDEFTKYPGFFKLQPITIKIYG